MPNFPITFALADSIYKGISAARCGGRAKASGIWLFGTLWNGFDSLSKLGHDYKDE